ncbi:MAG: hypothetical protein MUE40_05930 [Anaerolineae bacterium]|nr:hypothetical protein [Anaerolineae bacterium]
MLAPRYRLLMILAAVWLLLAALPARAGVTFPELVILRLACNLDGSRSLTLVYNSFAEAGEVLEATVSVGSRSVTTPNLPSAPLAAAALAIPAETGDFNVVLVQRDGTNIVDRQQATITCDFTLSQPPRPARGWEGDPTSFNYDGRLFASPADALAVYCLGGQLSVWTTAGVKVGSIDFDRLRTLANPDSQKIGEYVADGRTVELYVGRSNDTLTIVTIPDIFFMDGIRYSVCLRGGYEIVAGARPIR